MLSSTEIDFYVDHLGIVIPADHAFADEVLVKLAPTEHFNPLTDTLADAAADVVDSVVDGVFSDVVDDIFTTTLSDIVSDVDHVSLDTTTDVATDAIADESPNAVLRVIPTPSTHSTQPSRFGTSSGVWKYLAIAATGAFLVSCSQAPVPSKTAETLSSPVASVPQPSTAPANSTTPVQAVAVSSEEANAPSHTDTLEHAESLADQAATLAESAQSNDDWSLVNHRLERAIAMLESIPSSSPQYRTARAKRAEYENLLNDSSALSSRLIDASTTTSEAATMPTTPVAMASGFSCAEERSASEGASVELSNVQLMVPGNSGDLQLLGCITNHTDQTISNISLTYRGISTDNPSILQSGIDAISIDELSPGQTAFFRGGFGISRAVTDVTVDSVTWQEPGAEGPRNAPASIHVSH